ncbi:MAG: TauD/TfdA family dioxygenase [Rhodobacteraceae bacterium]|nr:TauD/TfdA family dioxygenase [Paracoccaceae bacterium]
MSNNESRMVPLLCGTKIDVPAASDAMSIDKQVILDAYNSSGAILIEESTLTREKFPDFTERFFEVFMEYVGGANNDRQSALKNSKTVLTVTGGNTSKTSVPLHGEMFYMKNRPSTLFFCCIQPAAEDGQTTLCDGVALWKALPQEFRSYFETNAISYRRKYDKDTWSKVYKTTNIEDVVQICEQIGNELMINDDGSIETVYRCHAYNDHHAGRAFVNSILVWAAREFIEGIDDSNLRLIDGSKIPMDMLYQINDIAEELTLNVPWKPGSVAIVDNQRFMHGRRRYEDTNRDIIMRLSDEAMPKTA